jgi:hypothetical protein
MMEQFDPEMFFHVVTLSKLAGGVDAEGGVVEAFGPPGPDLPCRVRFVHAGIGYGGGMETGLTPAEVAFPHDPGVTKGDRLTYLGRTIRAVAPSYTKDGDDVLFRVDGQVID